MRKKIIKLCFFLILLNLNSSMSAQTIGAFTGVSAAYQNENMPGFKTNLNFGLNFGFMVEFPIKKIVSFETDIILLKKGIIFRAIYENDKYVYKYNLYYLNIPIAPKFSFNVGNKKIFGKIGPYLGYGLFGKAKYKTSFGGSPIIYNESKLEFGPNSYKSIDYGLIVGGGIEIKSFQICTSYELGLSKPYPYHYFSLTLGYKFIDLKNKQK